MYKDTFALLPGFDKAFIAGDKLESVLQLSFGTLPPQNAQMATQEWKTRAFEVCMELINNEKSLKAAELLDPQEKSVTKACLETGLFSEIIKILGHLTKEFKREKISKNASESEEDSEEELLVHTNAGIAGFEVDSDEGE